MARKGRQPRITDGTPVQVWFSKDGLARIEKYRAALADPGTGREPSRAAVVESLALAALAIKETESTKESAA